MENVHDKINALNAFDSKLAQYAEDLKRKLLPKESEQDRLVLVMNCILRTAAENMSLIDDWNKYFGPISAELKNGIENIENLKILSEKEDVKTGMITMSQNIANAIHVFRLHLRDSGY